MFRKLRTATLLALALAAPVASAADKAVHKPTLVKVTFVTDWKAQAEHGGFYQAVATGLYAKAGLDVTIKQGGPSVNTPQLIAAGAVDFAMASNHFQPLNLAAVDADALAVAAIFQKDPQVLITHPRTDIKSIADMKGKPIMVSDATVSTWWVWTKARYGFKDSQIRKYTFNLAPFLSDPKAIQQGYVTSEPYTIETQGKIKPKVFMLADYGYPGYANMILARGKDVRERPKIVQAFVDASIQGWSDYLNADPKPANDLIMHDNPEMTADIIAQAIAQFKTRKMIQGGDAEKLGIGAMTDARWKTFFDMMSASKVFDAKLDYKKAYTTAFVNKPLAVPKPAATKPH
ncbi:MAG: ABC transporter substrate-binding protein [Alphaproteobacteria bacterium]|nr:ABC transporter substrate-binding protein [Alphaproteobacteria bacterium]